MTEVKHTAGPWSPMWQNSRARDCGGSTTHWEVPVCVGEWPNVGNVICIVHMGGHGATSSTKETVEANARLIAAAPALLASVVEFVGAVDSGTKFADQSVIDLARTALSKAGA